MKNIQFIVDLIINSKNLIQGVLVLTLALLALINDIKSYKIPNKLNLSFIIMGFIFNLIIGNIKNSFYGMLFPLILFPFFMARMMGAGDIKLFCALGMITGLPYIISIICYSVLFNGVIAVILLIVRKEKKGFVKLFYWIKVCIYTKDIVEYQTLDSSNKSIFRYAIGITLGCIYYIITDLVMGGTYALL